MYCFTLIFKIRTGFSEVMNGVGTHAAYIEIYNVIIVKENANNKMKTKIPWNNSKI